MSGKIETLKAAWPMLRRAIMRGHIFRPQCELVDADEDVEMLVDVRVPMEEGYGLTANVSCSRTRRRSSER